MKNAKMLALIGAIAITVPSLTRAADFGDLAQTRSFDRPDYSTAVVTRPAKVDVRNFRQNTCDTEGYQCASGYSCDFVMTMSGKDALDRPAKLSYGKTNLRYYSCELTGRLSRATCSNGLIPGKVISDDNVVTYYCQLPL